MFSELALHDEASDVARQLFGSQPGEGARFTKRVMDICAQAQGKDFLVIHNPGGWGSSRLDRCLDWERSFVEGVKTTIEHLGYSSLLTQYFRTGDSLWAHALDMKEQMRFFLRGHYSKAKVLAAELKFVTQHLEDVKIVMVGVSQGAAFSNAVMRQLGEEGRVYSIEVGTLFVHVPRRVVTDHTLQIDGNGVAPDPVVHRDLWVGSKVYVTAPLRWLSYQMVRKPRSFTRCIDLPGHDYSWEYPSVRQNVESFIKAKFGGGSPTTSGTLGAKQ